MMHKYICFIIIQLYFTLQHFIIKIVHTYYLIFVFILLFNTNQIDAKSNFCIYFSFILV